MRQVAIYVHIEHIIEITVTMMNALYLVYSKVKMNAVLMWAMLQYASSAAIHMMFQKTLTAVQEMAIIAKNAENG